MPIQIDASRSFTPQKPDDNGVRLCSVDCEAWKLIPQQAGRTEAQCQVTGHILPFPCYKICYPWAAALAKELSKILDDFDLTFGIDRHQPVDTLTTPG